MPSVTQSWMVATRRPAHERVTIADVAREAGVNKGTVSRALRGISGVGETTRQRILQAADRLEFSASHLATALATGTSQTVGIVLPTLRSWYFSEVAGGASEVLIPSAFRVELVNLDIDSDYLDVNSARFRALFRELGAGRGRDALLFAGTISTPPAIGAAETGHGQVPVAASGQPISKVPGIFIDHRAGAQMMAEHLLSLGHRSFAILDGRMPHKGPSDVWTGRTDAFCETVRAAGVELHDEMVLRPGDCHPEDGERAALELLARGPLPSAIFCHTDEMAFGVLSTFRRHGIRCPEDVSVAGFDGHPMAWLWGLTTVTQHAREQGRLAALALLAALVEDAPGDPATEIGSLSVELVVRDTTAARSHGALRPNRVGAYPNP